MTTTDAAGGRATGAPAGDDRGPDAMEHLSAPDGMEHLSALDGMERLSALDGMERLSALDGMERLSALCDGEVEAAEAVDACRRWQADARYRQRWHAWHVIGDVLRSEELAAGASGDGEFLAALRVRLAAEPVVLAPAPLPATVAARRRRAGWVLPAAAAAGFVLVAGTFVAVRTMGPGPIEAPRAAGATPSLATAAAVPAPAPIPVAAAAPVPVPAAVNPGRLIRDARLDRYLAAHKQFAGSTTPGFPQGHLRNATIQVEGR